MIQLSPPTPLTSKHNLDHFNCGELSLDHWLKERAIKNQTIGASRCFVICDKNNVIGYYTLSAGAICYELAPKSMRRNIPNPIPVLLLGRLAIDQKHHNKGFGSALLRDALLRAINVSKEAGIFAILIHAISKEAKQFYLSRGFVESPLQPMTLMMTLATVHSIFADQR